jgi:hypothetical protein
MLKPVDKTFHLCQISLQGLGSLGRNGGRGIGFIILKGLLDGDIIGGIQFFELNRQIAGTKLQFLLEFIKTHLFFSRAGQIGHNEKAGAFVYELVYTSHGI